ncbi:MAG: hypothetical protein RIR70_1150 [Pseudomonadota bacterium]|jgi:hypothetical protein
MQLIQKIMISAGILVASAGSAMANGDYQTDCVVPGATKLEKPGGAIAFFSANTNAGGGNGGEVAVLLGPEEEGGSYCYSGIPSDDKGVQYGNAQNPWWPIATDPGNSK